MGRPHGPSVPTPGGTSWLSREKGRAGLLGSGHSCGLAAACSEAVGQGIPLTSQSFWKAGSPECLPGSHTAEVQQQAEGLGPCWGNSDMM